jgi:hypothetical protein
MAKNSPGTDIQAYDKPCSYIVADGSSYFGPAIVTKEDGSTLETFVKFNEGEEVTTDLSPGVNLVPTCAEGKKRREKHEARAKELDEASRTSRFGFSTTQLAQIAKVVEAVNK